MLLTMIYYFLITSQLPTLHFLFCISHPPLLEDSFIEHTAARLNASAAFYSNLYTHFELQCYILIRSIQIIPENPKLNVFDKVSANTFSVISRIIAIRMPPSRLSAVVSL